MQHVLVCETYKIGRDHISNMVPFFFDFESFIDLQRFTYMVRLPSGRRDTIKLVAREVDIRGHRFNGIIFRTSNSTQIDDLFYYTKHCRRPLNQEIEDAETLCWHWSTADAYQEFGPCDHPIATLCWQSIRDKKVPA